MEEYENRKRLNRPGIDLSEINPTLDDDDDPRGIDDDDQEDMDSYVEETDSEDEAYLKIFVDENDKLIKYRKRNEYNESVHCLDEEEDTPPIITSRFSRVSLAGDELELPMHKSMATSTSPRLSISDMKPIYTPLKVSVEPMGLPSSAYLRKSSHTVPISQPDTAKVGLNNSDDNKRLPIVNENQATLSKSPTTNLIEYPEDQSPVIKQLVNNKSIVAETHARHESCDVSVQTDMPSLQEEIMDALLYPYDESKKKSEEQKKIEPIKKKKLPRLKTFSLKIIYEPKKTGFEKTKHYPIIEGSLIANRYRIISKLGTAAFCDALKCVDAYNGTLVCVKIIKKHKDFFVGMDEIKLLLLLNDQDPDHKKHIVHLYDCFWFKEHLFLVSELMSENLYQFTRRLRKAHRRPHEYFSMNRIQSICKQMLTALEFLHSLDIIHTDVKPENILFKSYSKCQVKLIDFGSSCFTCDHLVSYVQSRSYRAPEVILGLKYDQKIDIWSFGATIAELALGRVFFPNDSVISLLAKIKSYIGNFPKWMLENGQNVHNYITTDNVLFDLQKDRRRIAMFYPKKLSIKSRLKKLKDDNFNDFIKQLLTIDPNKRVNATQALAHPFLQKKYPADPEFKLP